MDRVPLGDFIDAFGPTKRARNSYHHCPATGLRVVCGVGGAGGSWRVTPNTDKLGYHKCSNTVLTSGVLGGGHQVRLCVCVCWGRGLLWILHRPHESNEQLTFEKQLFR